MLQTEQTLPANIDELQCLHPGEQASIPEFRGLVIAIDCAQTPRHSWVAQLRPTHSWDGIAAALGSSVDSARRTTVISALVVSMPSGPNTPRSSSGTFSRCASYTSFPSPGG